MGELFANPPSPSASTPWVLAHLVDTIATSPAAGTQESYRVDQAAPAALWNGQFRVVIDDEYMIATPGADGASPWVFTRGAEAPYNITPHAAGTAIYFVLTAGGLSNAFAAAETASAPATITRDPITGLVTAMSDPSGTVDLITWGAAGLISYRENGVVRVVQRDLSGNVTGIQ